MVNISRKDCRSIYVRYYGPEIKETTFLIKKSIGLADAAARAGHLWESTSNAMDEWADSEPSLIYRSQKLLIQVNHGPPQAGAGGGRGWRVVATGGEKRKMKEASKMSSLKKIKTTQVWSNCRTFKSLIKE